MGHPRNPAYRREAAWLAAAIARGSATDTKRGMVTAVPATAPELVEKIRNEIAFTAIEWGVFETIFDDTNNDILRSSAPGFFMVVNMALQRDVFLALARLTDPPKIGQYENISLRTLVEALPPDIDREAVIDLRARLDALDKEAASIRSYRMKFAAHNDLEYGLGRQPLPTSSREVVRQVLEGAARILEDAAQLISPGRIPRPLESSIRGGARRLLTLIAKAVADDAEELSWESFRRPRDSHSGGGT